MKKLSEKQRRRFARRARLPRRRLSQSRLLKLQQEIFFNAVEKFPVTVRRPNADGANAETLIAPKKLSLTHNFTETLGFLYAARELMYRSRQDGQRKRWVLDFSTIKSIGPAASLLLAAELDRFSSQVGSHLRPYVDTWQPQIKCIFHELGLLPFLGLPQYETPTPMPNQRLRFLPLNSGERTVGEDAEKLRVDLETLSGKQLNAPKAAYSAICEAMTNATQHAYVHKDTAWPAPYLRKWWAAGAFDTVDQTIHLFVYDQGVGIPRTLPRSTVWNQLRRRRLERNDASLIDAAIDLRRSSVPVAGRGRGLQDIVSMIDEEKQGRLRIVSGSGEVTYTPGQKRMTKRLNGRLLGTLVEWEFSANG